LARDCKNIIGVKEASGDLDQIKQIIDGAPEGFVVYSGDDALTYDVMKLGGVGVISTTANVLPARMKEIVELCAAGDWDSAWAAHEALLPIMKQLFATSNPILVKQALASLGFPVGGVKLPLVDATAEQTRELEEVLRKVGALQ
ncbi:MAG: dihydrodipicolinate synthase family protein, partial [Coriobacteriaceae bacterium]|nr:dihydrodipicolinate synthase family protein [Coriobacteriaceae bacterium]